MAAVPAAAAPAAAEQVHRKTTPAKRHRRGAGEPFFRCSCSGQLIEERKGRSLPSLHVDLRGVLVSHSLTLRFSRAVIRAKTFHPVGQERQRQRRGESCGRIRDDEPKKKPQQSHLSVCNRGRSAVLCHRQDAACWWSVVHSRTATKKHSTDTRDTVTA